jgi:hypothetical protein
MARRTPSPHLCTFALGLAALAAQPAAMQAVDDAAGHGAGATFKPSTRIARGDVAGAAFVDGALRGGGRDYKVEFRAGGFAYTPALGEAAPHNLPLAFELSSVERGGVVLAAGGPVEPALDGRRVTYALAPGVEERYDVLPEGIHQTFHVASPPPGSGDLVVRGRIATELPLAGATDDGGLLFAYDGIGGVTYGGVTGVDATGRTVAGELRLAGDALELVLPAAFVDSAAYPLVVDPLIGSELPIQTTDTYDDGDPDVAFDAGDNHYLVVWERRFSLTDIDVRGRLLEPDGSVAVSLIHIESTAALANAPSVATVRDSDTYFVAWQEAPSFLSVFNIRGRSVEVHDGNLSDAITVSATGNQELEPDVGGDKSLTDDDAFVVWTEQGVGIRGAQVTVPPDGATPFVLSTHTIEPEGAQALVNPAISKSSGEDLRFVVVWQAVSASTDAIYARAMTRNGTLLGTRQPVSFFVTGLSDDKEPDVDGDGTRFVAVWQREEGISSDVFDVYARAMTFENGDLQLDFGIDAIENDDDDDETAPSITYTGEQYVVAYTDQDSYSNVYLKIIDPYTCSVCAVESHPGDLGIDEHSPAITSMYHGGWSGGTFDDSLVVWESFEGGDADVLGHLFESPAGVESLGGDCGQAGVAVAPCPYGGNDLFRPRLLDGPASAPVLLAFGFQQAPFACGPCTLWPNLGTAAVLSTTTDADGEASIVIPVPASVVGETFTLQWAAPSGDACPLFGVDLSNGVELVIQGV